jgi:hypothetical protein
MPGAYSSRSRFYRARPAACSRDRGGAATLISLYVVGGRLHTSLKNRSVKANVTTIPFGIGLQGKCWQSDRSVSAPPTLLEHWNHD